MQDEFEIVRRCEHHASWYCDCGQKPRVAPPKRSSEIAVVEPSKPTRFYGFLGVAIGLPIMSALLFVNHSSRVSHVDRIKATQVDLMRVLDEQKRLERERETTLKLIEIDIERMKQVIEAKSKEKK